MPQELLRDVLRTGDASERARRRLSILPISIAAHVLAATLFVVIPLGAVPELPPIASPFGAHWIATVQPPSPPPPARPASLTPRTGAAPTSAPENIAPEAPETRSASVDDSIFAGIATDDSARALGGFGKGTVDVPVPPPAPPPPAPKPVRIGGAIKEPQRLAHVVPEYPEIARRARVEGLVILEAVLDATGRVQSVRVLRSSPLLDDAAIKAVQQWRYSPTELNGVAVPVLMTITVHFSLSR